MVSKAIGLLKLNIKYLVADNDKLRETLENACDVADLVMDELEVIGHSVENRREGIKDYRAILTRTKTKRTCRVCGCTKNVARPRQDGHGRARRGRATRCQGGG